MALGITYLGHSGFLLSDGKAAIAVDPFLTGNPLAVTKPGDVTCQFIALTHGHADHFGDTVPIAKANRATVIAAWEVANTCQEQGVANVEAGNPGGRIVTPFGWVAFTQAWHSSSYEGRYMGNPCGLMIHIAGVTVYHCGDTGIFSDMKLLSEIYRPEIACIPVGDRFTMGPELATRAAEMIRPKVAIPIHYNTWPPIAVDVSAFRPAGVQVRALRPGERMTYPG
jgi:L-ascorbate metabolism protein UlaG (beta-lactamase superfamily)